MRPSHLEGEYHKKQKAGQADSTKKQPASQSPAFRVILKWENPDETNWSKPNCERPQSHDEADLCEQRQTGELNKWQVRIGILTLFGLAFTAYFSYQTARAADKSAEHGRTASLAAVDAANAAQTQAAVANNTARNVERPYGYLRPIYAELTLIPFTERMGGEEGRRRNAVTFNYFIGNSGRLPAIVYEFHIETTVLVVELGNVVSRPPERPVYSEKEDAPIYEIISTDKEIAGGETLPIENLVSTNFLNIPLVFGFIRYSDPSGRSFQRGFGFLYRAGGKIYPYTQDYNYDREIEGSERPLPWSVITEKPPEV